MSDSHGHPVAEATWEGGASPFAVGDKKLGMWLFIVSDALTFAAMLMTYSYVRIANDWPHPFDFYPAIIFSSVMTLVPCRLLAVSLSLMLALATLSGSQSPLGPYLNSIITLDGRALDEAGRLDATLQATGALTGPLHGIPVILKDNIDTFDMPTTSGVALFKDFVPRKDAFLVVRLRQTGAIVLAKASLSELALGTIGTINSVLPGFTRNPYNTAHASGGSSGGTGVAIAANFGAVGRPPCCS